MLRAWLVGALTGLALFLMAGTASAALIHEFIDTRDGSTVGSIEFSAATPGTVSAFSLSGFGGPTLGLSDLCSPGNLNCELLSKLTSWTIDLDNWDLNSFSLVLDFGSSFSAGCDVELTIGFLSPASGGVNTVGGTASSLACALSIGLFPSDVDEFLGVLAVEPINEPPSLGIFIAALVGLALMLRRRKQPAVQV